MVFSILLGINETLEFYNSLETKLWKLNWKVSAVLLVIVSYKDLFENITV